MFDLVPTVVTDEEIVLRRVHGPKGTYRYGLEPCVEFAMSRDRRIKFLYEHWSQTLAELTFAHPNDIKEHFQWVL